MHTYQRLNVWKRSRAASLEAYQVTSRFPLTERYGLVNQIRRAAVSVPTNIVEGATRASEREFAHFLSVAEGSAAEVRHLLETSTDLGYVAAADGGRLASEYAEIGLMIAALRRHVARP